VLGWESWADGQVMVLPTFYKNLLFIIRRYLQTPLDQMNFHSLLRMLRALWSVCLCCGLSLGLWGLGLWGGMIAGATSHPALAEGLDAPGRYQQHGTVSFDGTGRFYLDREISQPMGHQGADWLERPRRAVEEQPQKLIHALNLQPTDAVADIGAGTGYITVRLSAEVPQGRVYAVDVEPETLAILQQTQAQRGVTNIEPILGEPDDPHLPPASVDLVLMVDAYHEFAYPYEMMTHIVAALKPQGRVVLAEYRSEDPFVFIKPLHKMTEAQVRREMEAVGLVWRETKNLLPQQHLLVFERSPEVSPEVGPEISPETRPGLA
jgi:precorrin-6B methylase 2